MSALCRLGGWCRGIIPGVLLSFLCVFSTSAMGAGVVHSDAMAICSIIINEMTEGKISGDRAKEISLAIAQAGNKHFGRVTCGDMWLYMAIVHVESGFRNNIINSENCRGMFQVHAPSWARKFGLRYVDLLDLHTNADSGIRVQRIWNNTRWSYPLSVHITAIIPGLLWVTPALFWAHAGRSKSDMRSFTGHSEMKRDSFQSVPRTASPARRTGCTPFAVDYGRLAIIEPSLTNGT